MPIGTPQSLGSNKANDANGFVTVTATANGAVGDHAFIFIGVDEIKTITSASDSVGNTYAVDVQRQATSTRVGTAAIASARITNAITSGVTTFRFDFTATGGTDKTIAAATVSGLAAASWFDKSSGLDAGTTSWSSGATATTSQADEILFGVAEESRHLTTSSPTGTLSNELFDFQGAADATLTVTYAIVSATGTYTATGTWGAATDSPVVIATYKAAPPSGGGPPFYPMNPMMRMFLPLDVPVLGFPLEDLSQSPAASFIPGHEAIYLQAVNRSATT